MKRQDVSQSSTEDLVRAYVRFALQQDEAVLVWQTKEANRLYWILDSISDELKSRPGDQRRALMPLYDHPNPQVRLKAAEATLAIAPEAAKAVLQSLRSINGPQRLDAGMLILGLEDGSFKPT